MTTAVEEVVFKRRGAAKELFRMDREDGRLPGELLIEGPAGTGKSRAWGEFLRLISDKYRGTRGAILRKTRASLTESFLVTWENEVLLPDDPCREGPSRAHRHSYQLPDNTEIWVGGLDNPTRLYSAQFDWIYVQEATELTLDEWERLGRALRNHKMPYQFLGADCNPDAPGHWLNQRCLAGKTARLLSRHKDNPAIRPEYLDRLRALTGVRRRRLYDGEWCAAEGAVWENFDRAMHVVHAVRDGDGKLDMDIRWTFASVDWGYDAPGVLAVWGVDGEGRMLCLAEIYQSQKSNDWWTQRAVELDKEFNLLSITCDPSRPDMIHAFNLALASSRNAVLSGVARGADNRRASTGSGDLSGIDLVRQRLVPAKDGRPRIAWLADCLRFGRDPRMIDGGQPCSTVEEIPSIVYREVLVGQPNREYVNPGCADHGFDQTRYAASFANEREWGPPKDPENKYPPGSYGELFGHEDLEE